MNTKTVWMGVGIFERLYSEKKLANYCSNLQKTSQKIVFILADEITARNTLVLNYKKFDEITYKSLLEKEKKKYKNKFLPKKPIWRG